MLFGLNSNKTNKKGFNPTHRHKPPSKLYRPFFRQFPGEPQKQNMIQKTAQETQVHTPDRSKDISKFTE
jgi:hypothetical protein